MLNVVKGMALDALSSPLAKGIGGGAAATVAFRATTGVTNPFVLGCVYAAGANIAMGMNNDSKVSSWNTSKNQA